jgi:hypothetical protein
VIETFEAVLPYVSLYMKNNSETLSVDCLLGLISKLLSQKYLERFKENERIILMSETIIEMLCSYLNISSNLSKLYIDKYTNIIDLLFEQIKEFLEDKNCITDGKREKFLKQAMELLCYLTSLYSEKSFYSYKPTSINNNEKNKLLLQLFVHIQKKLEEEKNKDDFKIILYYCGVLYGFLYSPELSHSDYLPLANYLKMNVNNPHVEKVLLDLLGQKAVKNFEKKT